MTAGGHNLPRILHVLNALDAGGMERTLLSLVAGTSDRFDHVICTLRGPGPLADRVPASARLVSLGVQGRRAPAAIGLARVIRSCRPALVHARSWGVWADAALGCVLGGRPPLILSFHGLQSDTGFGRRDRMRARWLRCLCRRYACVSRAGTRQLVEELGIPSSWITLLPNGVDTDRFRPHSGDVRARARAALGLPQTAFIAGTTGSLTPVKDHVCFLRGLRQCRDAGTVIHGLVVGDGPLRADLAERVRQEGMEGFVHFTGRRDDGPQLLAAMDVYVCSSRSEGMSNAVLEAMAAGLPVVATDVGDNGWLLDGGRAGVLVPPRAPQPLASAICRLAEDEAVRRALGDAARRCVCGQFTSAGTRQHHVSLYTSVLDEVSRPQRRPALALP
ncbi:MAG: glycosyltransferase [Phycisphaerae bacterium]|nr:glycosyltransferase [Phycisphaerae bacterium]